MSSNDESWDIFLPKEEEKIKLDIKDIKILDKLINNSRTMLPELCRISRLSKPSIINRIQNLESANIITGYTTYIDFLKLGIKIYDLLIKTGLPLIKKQDYINYLKKNPSLIQIITLSHKDYDVMIRVFDLEDNIDEIILYVTSYSVQDLNISFVKKNIYQGLDLFNIEQSSMPLRKDASFNRFFSLPEKVYEHISSEDVELLYLLSQNSRRKINELAERTGLSPDTVKNKIKSLIAGKVIITFFAKYDVYRLGFHSFVLRLKIFNRAKEKEIFEFLKNHGRCHGIIRYEESWDALAYLSFKDRGELGKFENKLLELYGEHIKDYEFILVQEQVYYNTFPKKLKEDLLLKLGSLNSKINKNKVLSNIVKG